MVHVPTVSAGSHNRVSQARPDHCWMLHLIFTYPTCYFASKMGPLLSPLKVISYHDGVPNLIFSFPTTVVKTFPIPDTCPDPPANMTSAKLSAINWIPDTKPCSSNSLISC